MNDPISIFAFEWSNIYIIFFLFLQSGFKNNKMLRINWYKEEKVVIYSIVIVHIQIIK